MIRHWLLAARPKTLPVAMAPVIVGTALAWADGGQARLGVMVVILGSAMLIQIATNLHNDVADHERGADDPATRLGPPRATAEGWLAPERVRLAAVLSFAAAGVLGVWLIRIGGWPIAAIGVASLVAGWSYSGGPRPIAYTSLGEFFVWLFFGVVAVSGTFLLQTGSVSTSALLAGAALGMPAAAVLVVNNTRDLDNDRRAGRRTFAVQFGRRASCWQYALLMILPFCAVPFLIEPCWPWALAPFVLLPLATGLTRRFVRSVPGPQLNILLAETARFQLLFSLLLAVSLVLATTHAGA
jgi:1,4-dihydroxy-2-naphthoate octaprenyltransferase